MPSHNHLMQGTTGSGSQVTPNGATFGSGARGEPPFYAAQGTSVPMAPQAIGLTGGGQPHNNMQPYLGVKFIIALQGVYPPRN
jgi:microcystin-dependent protein